jgi:hypothetical protein
MTCVWSQVDLGDYATVSSIVVWNRADEAPGQDPLKNLKRLFPFWIIASREPFDDVYGEEGFTNACSHAVVRGGAMTILLRRLLCLHVANINQVNDGPRAVLCATQAKKRFGELARKVVWRLPERKLVRYVRIQLEQQNFLTLAQVSACATLHPCVSS